MVYSTCRILGDSLNIYLAPPLCSRLDFRAIKKQERRKIGDITE